MATADVVMIPGDIDERFVNEWVTRGPESMAPLEYTRRKAKSPAEFTPRGFLPTAYKLAWR